jgi:putative CocE/NonD family hydrolase
MSDIRVLSNLRVPMRDGVHLAADVYLPAGATDVPVILTRTPYDAASDRFISLGVYFASRGYAVVSEDCRGCYRSEGAEFRPWFDDALDGYDTLEWLSHQSWCSGRVGMWGPSYMGYDQWLVAPLRHPVLKALVPQVTPSDYWRQGAYVMGATFLMMNDLMMLLWASSRAMSIRTDLYDHQRVLETLPLVDADIVAVGRRVPWFQDWLAHPTYDDYWRSISNEDKFGEMEVAAFNQCGWYDAYPGSAFINFNGLVQEGRSEFVRNNQKVLIGPWSHSLNHSPGLLQHDVISRTTLGDCDFGPSSLYPLAEEQSRWFDYYLKGIDNGVAQEPPVQIFVMGINEWRTAPTWPLPGTTFCSWYLDSGGSANSLLGDGRLLADPPERSVPDCFTYDPERPVPSLGGNHSMQTWEHILTVGPVDQRPLERRDDVLVYRGAPLERDLCVTGPVIVKLFVSSSAPDTDFTARLIDHYPGGYAQNICEGIVRARYRDSWSTPSLMAPGEVYELTIDLQVTSNVFRRGHRIGLDISSSNFPRYDRNLNTGLNNNTTSEVRVAQQTVYHDAAHPSRLILPIVEAC